MTTTTGSTVDGEAWELVRAAQSGADDGFQALYNRYYAGIFRYVLSRTGTTTLAEDLSSETFLRALRSIGSVRYLGKDVRAWLTTIARNVVTDHYKAGFSRREIVTDEVVDAAVVDSAEQAALKRMHRIDMYRALDQLTPAQRRCVLLRFYRAFSVAATGEAMCLNPAAVRALQHRALRKLADVLADEAGDSPRTEREYVRTPPLGGAANTQGGVTETTSRGCRTPLPAF
jgi:RNA polymerase sigma-70 factor (ECF subfamily)